MQFKKYLKLITEQTSGSVERKVKSSDVMPLIDSADLTDGDGEGGGKLGEDFDLDDGAKINDKRQKGPGNGPQKEATKGDLGKIIDQLAKKQEQLDKHVKDGKSIKVIKVPKGSNAPDYVPSFPENPQADLEAKKAETEQQLDQTNNRGIGIGGDRKNDGTLHRTKTNWRALLRNTAVKVENLKRVWNKVNKRMFAANIQLPGKVKDESGVDIVFALDTSGSIGDKTLSIFISEIFKVAKEFEGEASMRIMLWHTDVYMDCKVSREYSPAQILSAVRRLPTKSGGTTLSCIRDYFAKEKMEVENQEALYLVVLTDGYVESDPVMPKEILKENRIFLVIEGGSLSTVKTLGGRSLFIDVYR